MYFVSQSNASGALAMASGVPDVRFLPTLRLAERTAQSASRLHPGPPITPTHLLAVSERSRHPATTWREGPASRDGFPTELARSVLPDQD